MNYNLNVFVGANPGFKFKSKHFWILCHMFFFFFKVLREVLNVL